MNKKTFGDKVFDFVNYLVMIAALIATLFPIWYIIVASLSDGIEVQAGNVLLWVKGFTLETYETVFQTKNIWTSYANTIYYAFIGTGVSMILTILGGYSLSKPRLEYRKTITLLILISMWLSPGMMPTYLNFRDLGLLNNRIGILICGAVSSFYFVLMRTFFESIPDSLEESAKLDGASDWDIMVKIFIPLSVPAIMTLTLYYFVGRWNSYFWSMIMLSDETKIPLQVLLKKMVVEMSALYSEKGSVDYTSTSRETMVYSMMVIAVMPMLIIYPFVQKFFVKGIMIGSVKG